MKPLGKVLLLLILFSLSACSVNDARMNSDGAEQKHAVSGQTGEPLIAPEPEDITYIVEPGDMLSAIAKKMTGDGENWRKIALYNGIDDPSHLKVDDIVMIPGYMLRNSEKALPLAQTIAEIDAGNSNNEDGPVNNTDSEVIPPALEVDTQKQQQSEVEDVKNTNSESITTNWVMVEGSYYPKAIYAQPDYVGGLLVRVRPGTTLKHLSDIDDWVEVETELGIGYIHRSDVRKVEKREVSARSVNEF